MKKTNSPKIEFFKDLQYSVLSFAPPPPDIGSPPQEGLEEWRLALPLAMHADLGHCLGALALHLTSRFDTLLNSWRALTGAAPPTPTSREGGAQPTPGCEWLAEQGGANSLPDFPNLPPTPSEFRPPLLPLPRLLLPAERLQADLPLEGDGWGTPSKSEHTPATWVGGAFGHGAVGGAAVAFALGGGIAVWMRQRRQRGGVAQVGSVRLRVINVAGGCNKEKNDAVSGVVDEGGGGGGGGGWGGGGGVE